MIVFDQQHWPIVPGLGLYVGGATHYLHKHRDLEGTISV